MSFLKRLGFYLIGLSIGLIFLVIFLKNKSEETGTSFCYFPNCRVLKELRAKPQNYSAEFQELLDNGAIDSLGIANFLTDGDIDFRNSDTKSEPCKTYRIRGLLNEAEAVLVVDNCKDTIELKAIE
ncbi:MAG: DUF4258 domain-containing protein [Eudoraea sp.]|nr:DUF4258 domain-containing protein [Eudoraea sp.]NNJ40247.1 DUF4258 domain-containing protein [Eudoraea sp.]